MMYTVRICHNTILHRQGCKANVYRASEAFFGSSARQCQPDGSKWRISATRNLITLWPGIRISYIPPNCVSGGWTLVSCGVRASIACVSGFGEGSKI
ncbi:hypothetical protein BDV23DRAFT_144887 [Aspergillus alliaceus]|uniref:Uncharacterized protein n=1 Tax=Petromyces alliaceus TaxID=209559 RepID=A0A5N7CQ71_PETAA|nr:hypothetical protein BDV23DRAFT_144887 [Aspergillus alliaceus]